MARLTNIKRIIKEQLPADVQKWIDTLLFPLNNAIAQFTAALTNSLTITDNMAGSLKSFTLKTSDFPFSFQHGLSSKPQLCIIAACQDAASGIALFTTGVYAQWEQGSDGSSVLIRNITGLDATKSYNVTFWVQSS